MTLDELMAKLEGLKQRGVSGSSRVNIVWWNGDLGALGDASVEDGVVYLNTAIESD